MKSPYFARTRTRLYIFSSIFLILLLATVQGCQEQQILSIEEHLERGQFYQEQQNFEASIIELKVVLQGDPDHAQARLLLAKAQLALGDASSAETQLRRAQKLGMSKQNVQTPLLHALILQNRYEEVLIESDTSVSKAPTETLFYLRGLASFGLERLDDAREAFEQALDANPEAVDPFLGLAKVALAENRLEEADDYLQPVLNQRIEAWLLKGQLEMAGLNFKEAEHAYCRVLNKHEHYVPAKLGQIRSLLALGNTPAAIDKIEQTLNHSPQLVEAHYLKAISALVQDDFVVAQASAWEALRLDRHHMPSIGVLGFVDYAMGHLEQAEANLSRYLRVRPEDTTARKTLAATRLKLGLTAAAMDALEPVLEKNPDDPGTLMLMGAVYLASLESSAKDSRTTPSTQAEPNINVVQVRAILEGAVREHPVTGVADSDIPAEGAGSNKYTEILKAIAFLPRKDHDKALEVIEEAAEKYPNDALILVAAGMIYDAKGDSTLAYEKFQQAEELDPDGTDTSLHLAQMAEDEEDSESACAHYLSILKTDSSNVQAIQGVQHLNCQTPVTDEHGLTEASSEFTEAKVKREVKASQEIEENGIQAQKEHRSQLLAMHETAVNAASALTSSNPLRNELLASSLPECEPYRDHATTVANAEEYTSNEKIDRKPENRNQPPLCRKNERYFIKRFLSDLFDQSTRLTADFAVNQQNASTLLKIAATSTYEERSELYRMLLSISSNSPHSMRSRSADNAGATAQQAAYVNSQNLELPPELRTVFNAIRKVFGFLAKIKDLIYNYPLITALIGLVFIVIFEFILRLRTRNI